MSALFSIEFQAPFLSASHVYTYQVRFSGFVHDLWTFSALSGYKGGILPYQPLILFTKHEHFYKIQNVIPSRYRAARAPSHVHMTTKYKIRFLVPCAPHKTRHPIFVRVMWTFISTLSLFCGRFAKKVGDFAHFFVDSFVYSPAIQNIFFIILPSLLVKPYLLLMKKLFE